MINYEKMKLVTCQLGCNGKKNLCIPIIIKWVKKRYTVFIMYGAYVKEQLDLRQDVELVYEIKYSNDIPIGLYIALK
jgi:hypothetical protein